MSLHFLYHAWFSTSHFDTGISFSAFSISAVKFSDKLRGFCFCYVSRYNHFVPSLRPLGRLIKKLPPFKHLKPLHLVGFHILRPLPTSDMHYSTIFQSAMLECFYTTMYLRVQCMTIVLRRVNFSPRSCMNFALGVDCQKASSCGER